MVTYNDTSLQELNGFIISVKDIQYNKRFLCDKSCSYLQNLLRGTFNKCIRCIDPKAKGSFTCTEVTIHIVATSSVGTGWFCDHHSVTIITTNGNTFRGMILCDEIEKERIRAGYCMTIESRSQSDIIYTFPCLSKGEQVKSVMVKDARFDVLQIEDEGEYNIEKYRDILSANNEAKKSKKVANEIERTFAEEIWQIKQTLVNSVNQLRINIFKRFNTHLSTREIETLEDKIETQIFSLNLEFKSKYDDLIKTGLEQVYTDFKEEVTNYREVLLQKRAAEAKHDFYLKRATDLMNIDPYDFEYVCSTIMDSMGYTNVRVTPRSNDKGIDIEGEMDEKKVVAQCKRYKSSIGSPDIQFFIGAMHNARAEFGVYFTTGLFTKEAEIMAEANNIDLFGMDRFIKYFSLIDDL